MLKNLLTPNWDIDDLITSITLKDIRERNLKALLLDVDGTLIPKNSSDLDPQIINWINSLKKDIPFYLISNNLSYKRISNIGNLLHVPYKYRAFKPRSSALKKAIYDLNVKSNAVGIVGDKIFTDVLAGNRLGIYTILVKTLKKSLNNKGIAKKSLIGNITDRLQGI